ncbi:hypothetical protein ACLOJK_018204 [Asimina triloba]
MLFLSWNRPSSQQQKACIDKSGGFNYDSKYRGGTCSSPTSSQKEELANDGFFLNEARILLGSGLPTFNLAKTALLNWRSFVSVSAHQFLFFLLFLLLLLLLFIMFVGVGRFRHFNLSWAFVDPKTPLQKGTKFCVCARELLPWLIMPLQIACVVDENSNTAGGDHLKLRRKASFGFGSGTLHGHLLAGEERFSVELDEENQVWYEIYSFSKPAHILSVLGYPYVQLRQKFFAQQSMQSLLMYVNSQKDKQESSH